MFCVCFVYVICPPCLPSPYTTPFPSYHLHSYPFLLFMRFSECLKFCLLPTFHFYFLYFLIIFYIYFYTLYIAFLFYGSYISMVFKIGSTVLQRTIYDPILEAILIPECTYFTCKTLKLFIFDTKIG